MIASPFPRKCCPRTILFCQKKHGFHAPPQEVSDLLNCLDWAVMTEVVIDVGIDIPSHDLMILEGFQIAMAIVALACLCAFNPLQRSNSALSPFETAPVSPP